MLIVYNVAIETIQIVVYTLCLKKRQHFYFRYNSTKQQPIFKILSPLERELYAEQNSSKVPPPHLKIVAALPCETWTWKFVEIGEENTTK